MPEAASLFAGGAPAFAARAPRAASPLAPDDRQAPPMPRGLTVPGVTLTEAPFATVWQITAWPGETAEAEKAIAALTGAPAPAPGRSAGQALTAMRTAPLGWWLVGDEMHEPPRPGRAASVLDLSHARWRFRLSGPARDAVLARLVSIDLRPGAFGPGAVALTPIHHLGVVLHARDDGTVDLYVPRSQARALWRLIVEVAAAYGCACA